MLKVVVVLLLVDLLVFQEELVFQVVVVVLLVFHEVFQEELVFQEVFQLDTVAVDVNHLGKFQTAPLMRNHRCSLLVH